jgi:DNA-binding response OmpR family regulator
MMSHQRAAQVTVTEANLTEPARTHGTLTEGTDPAARRILIVDDEPNIRSFIGRALAAAGYLTGFAGSGTEGLRHALDEHYDLIILDLVMPDLDGCDVLDQLLRARPDQTVMVLSCVADVATKVDCLERGARDYLTKPFSLDELLARVRNQLRGFDRVIRAGEITLHVGRMEADIGHGPLRLTRLEFLVLKELMEHAGQALSKSQLLESVWGYDFDPGSNIVGVCVSRLRSKIGDHAIRTVRGEGYRLAVG